MSRVSCDLLVLGAKCETVVIFGLPPLFFDNTYTLVFKSGRSAAVLRWLPSCVLCDLLVLGAKCETLVIFGLLEVVCAVFLTTLTHLCSKVDDPLRF